MKDLRTVMADVANFINDEIHKDHNISSFPVGRTFLHIIERLGLNVSALLKLTEDSYKDHFHAIGLISRNIYTDFLLVCYFSQISADREADLYRMLNRELDGSDNYVNLLGQYKIISVEVQQKYFERYKTDSDERKIRDHKKKGEDVERFPSTTELIKLLLNRKEHYEVLGAKKKEERNPWIEYAIHTFDKWKLFSSFEHVGLAAYQSTREISDEKSFVTMAETMKVVCLALAVCFDLIEENLPSKKSLEYFEDFRGIVSEVG